MTIQQDQPAFEDDSFLIRTTIRGSVLQVAGELDLDTSTHLFNSASAASDPSEPITIDMSEVTFIDSSALGVLVRVGQTRKVTIVEPSEQVRRLLEITGLTEWFGLERDTEHPAPQN